MSECGSVGTRSEPLQSRCCQTIPSKYSPTCGNLGRKLAFSGLNLSHFAPLNLCENDQDVYLKVFGNRLKSYSIDDNLHYASVEYISALAQAYFKDGFSTLPLDTHISEADTQGIVSHWYRLSSLVSLFVQEESK